MNKLKLTGFAALALGATLIIQSCKKDEGKTLYTNDNIVLSSSRVVTTPGNTLPPTTGFGKASATYDKTTKTLSYTINWDTLSAAPIAIHLHALGDSGNIALPSPLGPFGIDSFKVNTTTFVKYVGGIAQKITLPTSPAPTKKGSFTGSVYADGLVIKEEDILAGKYYIDIHTASNPLFIAFGELRGQITFPQ